MHAQVCQHAHCDLAERAAIRRVEDSVAGGRRLRDLNERAGAADRIVSYGGPLAIGPVSDTATAASSRDAGRGRPRQCRRDRPVYGSAYRRVCRRVCRHRADV